MGKLLLAVALAATLAGIGSGAAQDFPSRPITMIVPFPPGGAVGRVARAAPDGATIGFGNWSTNVVNGAIYALPYDLLNDLEPIALVATTPQVILSSNVVPAQSLATLI